ISTIAARQTACQGSCEVPQVFNVFYSGSLPGSLKKGFDLRRKNGKKHGRKTGPKTYQNRTGRVGQGHLKGVRASRGRAGRGRRRRCGRWRGFEGTVARYR